MKFCKIQSVPQSTQLIDIVLNTTQRKTPTVIHSHFQITRIRNFYMKKIKMSTNEFSERLMTIINQFPVLENIHPFYADLLNVLYDKDHYKMALGHVSSINKVVKKTGTEFLKLMKFGDSLYRCKQLKKACLGKMATYVKKLKSDLEYLEEVRQHMSRLPTIDLEAPTVVICGHPNVGKSSFMNKITNAKVDVQPYAFTTKNIFVGHLEHKGVKFQIIDTPGLLDHEIELRNNIEMQSIVALVHLNAKVLFFIDKSGECGYSLAQQILLYDSLNILTKDSVVVLSKADLEIREDREELEKFLNGKIWIDLSVRENKNVDALLDLVCGEGLKVEEVEVFGKKCNEKVAAEDFIEEKPIDFVIPEIMNGKNIMDMVLVDVPKVIRIEREYDVLDEETVELKKFIDDARIAKIKENAFKNRATLPEKWKKRIVRKPFVQEIVLREKGEKKEPIKRMVKIESSKPKHLFRGKSKHGRR